MEQSNLKATKCKCKSCSQDRVSDLRLRGAKEKKRVYTGQKLKITRVGDPDPDFFWPNYQFMLTEDKIFIVSILRTRIRIRKSSGSEPKYHGSSTLANSTQAKQHRRRIEKISVVDPYSFFTDPDPELDVGGQYGSRALITKN
jgi:hypothetical protein